MRQKIALCKLALKAWPNARNISTQHLATLLHDVATSVEWTGQTHATYRYRVAKRTQHVVPNKIARSCVEMLRAFWPGLKGALATTTATATRTSKFWKFSGKSNSFARTERASFHFCLFLCHRQQNNNVK